MMNSKLIVPASILAVVALAGSAAAGSIASISKKGTPLAFAKINSDATVAAFGGKGTESVTVGSCGAGDCFLTFNGKYPSDITPGKIVMIAFAEAGGYSVVNGLVMNATPTAIEVGVARFNSSAQTNASNGFHVTVTAGR